MSEQRGALCGINYSGPITNYRGERVARLSEALLFRRRNIPRVVAVDTFYSLYLPAPVPDESASCNLCKVIVKVLVQSKQGIKLRTKTVLDPLLSTLTAAAFLSRLYEKYSEDFYRPDEQESTKWENIADEIRNLVSDVSSEVENISRIRLALEGLEPGSLSILSIEDYSLELLRLAKETDIKRILEILEGIKYQGFITSKRHRPFKRGEKQGFILGSDVERIAPSNLLCDDEIFFTRLAQGRLLLYNKVVQESKGPIYVLLDKSGSMEGEKILWAKAVAIALYMRALRTRQEFYIRFFDSQPYSLLKLGRRSNSSDAIKVFEYIARVRSAGGTDITRALITAISDLGNNAGRESSIVLITDGIDRVVERPVREGLRRKNAKLITVMVKGENKSLLTLSKEYLSAIKLDREEIIRVVKALN